MNNYQISKNTKELLFDLSIKPGELFYLLNSEQELRNNSKEILTGQKIIKKITKDELKKAIRGCQERFDIKIGCCNGKFSCHIKDMSRGVFEVYNNRKCEEACMYEALIWAVWALGTDNRQIFLSHLKKCVEEK